MSADDTASRTPWSPVKRGAFRFVLTYLLIYYLPYPAGDLPGTTWLSDVYRQLWQ